MQLASTGTAQGPGGSLSGEGSKEVTFEPGLCLRLGDGIEGDGGRM